MLTLICALLLTGFSGNAQYVKRDGEFKDAVDGETLFTLTDRSFIWATRAENRLWYDAGKRVIFDIGQMSADSVLSAGTVLYNEDYEVIGSVKQPTDVHSVLEFGGFRKDEFHSGIIKGFISTYDCYVNSRPEDAVTDVLESARGNVGRALAPVLSDFPFETESSGQYTVHVLLNRDQENFREDFPFRMIIVMRGEASIICIVSETEYIRADKAKGEEQMNSHYITWFQRSNPRMTEEIESIIYRYLPL